MCDISISYHIPLIRPRGGTAEPGGEGRSKCIKDEETGHLLLHRCSYTVSVSMKPIRVDKVPWPLRAPFIIPLFSSIELYVM